MSNNFKSINLPIHQKELSNVLIDILARINGPNRRTFPSRYSSYLWHKLGDQPIPALVNVDQGVNHAIRQIHDFYGWMARHGRNGNCAGTLYRSLDFMQISPSERNGSKSSKRNIHIEHTVPVATLNNYLTNSINKFSSPESLHWNLIQHSICVGLSYIEEKQLSLAAVAKSSNDAFASDGHLVHDFPFRRYLPMAAYAKSRNCDFVIIDITTGKEIDLENFTFTDHQESLERAAQYATSHNKNSYEIFGI